MKATAAILLLTLTLCACKGRTASVPVSDGDTVEVVVGTDEMEEDASDSAFVPARETAPSGNASETPETPETPET